ncbi:hypothetical protein ACLB2K_011980 [Fragaria x ananassa]
MDGSDGLRTIASSRRRRDWSDRSEMTASQTFNPAAWSCGFKNGGADGDEVLNDEADLAGGEGALDGLGSAKQQKLRF